MVAVARDTLPAHRVSVLVGALEDPLPEGPFDLVVSARRAGGASSPADGKADLFRRIANALEPGGRFVLADVVTPLSPSYVVTPIDPEVDYPSTLDEQLAWLDASGISPEVTWTHRDLVVLLGPCARDRGVIPRGLGQRSGMSREDSATWRVGRGAAGARPAALAQRIPNGRHRSQSERHLQPVIGVRWEGKIAVRMSGPVCVEAGFLAAASRWRAPYATAFLLRESGPSRTDCLDRGIQV